MKRTKLLVVVALALVICMPGLADASFIQTFDSNNAGFVTSTIITDTTSTEVPALWSGSGGAPDGHIYAGVDDTADKLYSFLKYPSAIFGDLNGTYLTTAFKTEGTIDTSTPLVRFYVGIYISGYSYYVTKDAYSWNPNNDTNWTTHSVYVTSDNFIPWPGPGFDNTKTFAYVMAHHEDIGVFFSDSGFDNYGFSSTAGATLRVDNFGSSAVPLPSTVLLLGSGLLGLAGWRRFRKG